MNTKRTDAPVSRVTGVNPTIEGITTIGAILEAIKTGDVSHSDTLIDAYTTDKTAYDALKGKLSGFLVGEFSKRNAQGCTTYVPLLVLDVDKIENETVTSWLFELICQDPHTYAAFRSPSGHGIRVLVWSNNIQTEHAQAYEQVTAYYTKAIGLPTDKERDYEHFDTSAKAFPRFWYYTPQPPQYVYHNEESTTFLIGADTEKETEAPAPNPAPSVSENNTIDLTDSIRIEVVEKLLKGRNIQLVSGKRNNYIFHFAALAREHGVTDSEIFNHAYSLCPDKQQKEIAATVESAINRTRRKFEDGQIKSLYRKMTGTNAPAPNPAPSVQAVQSNQNGTVKKSQNYHEKKIPDYVDYRAKEVHEAKRSENKYLVLKSYLETYYDFRYNEIANKVEISPKGKDKFEELNKAALTCELFEFGLNSPQLHLDALLGNTHFCPPYDRFLEYYEKLPKWDGKTDAIKNLCSYINTEDENGKPNTEWTYLMLKKAFIRTVACSLGRKVNKQCIVFFGKQNDGKSHFVKYICPKLLRDYYKEGHDNPDNKDSLFSLARNFIINFDELGGLSKWEISKLKAQFTIDTINQRRPFGTDPALFKRRATFWGNTNKDDFLNDETGSVRWVVIRVNGINHDHGGANGYHSINMDDVYAQAYALHQAGESGELTADELAKSEETNKGFQIESMEKDLIMKFFEPDPDLKKENIYTASSLKLELESLVKAESNITTVLSLKFIGQALGFLGIPKKAVRDDRFKTPIKGYFLRKVIQLPPPTPSLSEQIRQKEAEYSQSKMNNSPNTDHLYSELMRLKRTQADQEAQKQTTIETPQNEEIPVLTDELPF